MWTKCLISNHITLIRHIEMDIEYRYIQYYWIFIRVDMVIRFSVTLDQLRKKSSYHT